MPAGRNCSVCERKRRHYCTSRAGQEIQQIYSFNVLCAVLSVHFPDSVICDVIEMPGKGALPVLGGSAV